MSDVLKLDYEKVINVGNKLKDMGNTGKNGGVNNSTRRLLDTADGKNFSAAGFLNLMELSADFVQDANLVIGKVESMGLQFIDAANAIKNGDLAAANQYFKDSYRVDELKFDNDSKSWYENTTYGYSVVSAAYDVAELGADKGAKATEFLKGLKTTLDSSEIASQILAKGGKLGKILPVVNTILGIKDVYDGSKGYVEETNRNIEELQNTGDVADYSGNQTGTTINNGINIVAGGLAIAGGVVATMAIFGTAPVWGPVVLTAGAIAGGVWLANEGIGWLTGKKAGDWIGDGVRATGDFIGNVADGIGRLFSW